MYDTEPLAATRGPAGGQPEPRRVRNFIDGDYRAGDRWFDKRSPLDNAVIARVAEAVRDVTKLRGEVEVVGAGALPNDGKVIEDARSYE